MSVRFEDPVVQAYLAAFDALIKVRPDNRHNLFVQTLYDRCRDELLDAASVVPSDGQRFQRPRRHNV